jgi:hypothetical protein
MDSGCNGLGYNKMPHVMRKKLCPKSEKVEGWIADIRNDEYNKIFFIPHSESTVFTSEHSRYRREV